MTSGEQSYVRHIQAALDTAIALADGVAGGNVADYIPELAHVDPSILNGAIRLSNGGTVTAGNALACRFTLQSVSKLVLLTALLEELGEEQVFQWVDVEPSGRSFAAIGDLEGYGPVPSNPLINAGAIALAAHIPGVVLEARLHWIHCWMSRIFGVELRYSEAVEHSEFTHGHRNRALAYMMRATGVITTDPEISLKLYYRYCAYEATVEQAARLPLLLANGGLDCTGERVISERTSNIVLAVMATCGLYNESGVHLVRTGMPAKTGVSGLIVAVATGRAGVAFHSPLLNDKGGSVRGHIALESISTQLGWNFAAPWGHAVPGSHLHKDDD